MSDSPNQTNNKEEDTASSVSGHHPSDTKLPELYVRPGQPIPPTPGDQENYIVTFADDDPARPLNWPMWKRAFIKGLASANITVVAWGSSAIAPGTTMIMEDFHVGLVPATLAVSLYVLGFATGPIVWGPGSELYGRRLPLIVGMFGFTLFAFACATAKDFQTLMLCRFFMGAFGCSTLVVGPSISADCFTTEQRGLAVSMVILCLCCGPMIAPVVSGYIAFSYLGWRWTMYITGIMGALGLVTKILFLTETYPEIRLREKAQHLRKETGNWAISAPIESMELDLKEVLNNTVLKPFKMLAVEPILTLLSLYHGFIYGILYLCLEAIPVIFRDGYHWHRGNIYLPYLGMFSGSLIMIILNILYFDKVTIKLLHQSGRPVYPEARLPLMMASGIVFPIGIFLMCWAGAYHAHWIVTTIGAALLGGGLIGIFLAAMCYIIDAYLPVAASAIAANTFTRSAMGASFPLFATAMFKNLGDQWAGTLLGCLAVLLAPAPFCFYFFGPWIRSKSKFAINDADYDTEEVLEELQSDPVSRASRTSRRSRHSTVSALSFTSV